jgi:predicted nuclease with TOPRIM domain
MSRRNSVNDLDADFVYAFKGGTDIVERLREGVDHDPDDVPRAEALMDEAADEIERLQHMQANLHGHIKRLEDENSKLRKESAIHASNTLAAIDDYNDALAENAKLREALEKIADSCGDCEVIARASLQKDEGE